MNRIMRLVGKSETTEICSEINLHNRCFLCDLSGDPLRDFDTISLTSLYPRGVKLFVEGQHPKGVFILCSGRAKLLIGSKSEHVTIGTGSNFLVYQFVTKQVEYSKATAYARNKDT